MAQNLDFTRKDQFPISTLVDAVAQKAQRESALHNDALQRGQNVVDNLKQAAETTTSMVAGLVQQSKLRQQRDAANALANLFSKSSEMRQEQLPPGVQGPLPKPQMFGETPAFQSQAKSLLFKAAPDVALKQMAEQLFSEKGIGGINGRNGGTPPRSFESYLIGQVNAGLMTKEEAAKQLSVLKPNMIFLGTDESGQPLFSNTRASLENQPIVTGETPGGSPVFNKDQPTTIKTQIRDIDDQFDQLKDLKVLLKDIPAGPMGGVESLISKATFGNVGEKVKQYNDLRPAIATKIYRAATGDTRLSDADAAARAYPLLPDPVEPLNVRQAKIKNIERILLNRKNNLLNKSSGKSSEGEININSKKIQSLFDELGSSLQGKK